MSHEDLAVRDNTDISVFPHVGAIGKLLLESGHLTKEQSDKVVKFQLEKNVRFGEAAIELGYIKEEDIQFALSQQFSYTCLARNDLRISQDLVAAFSPFSAFTEQLRTLRSELMQRWVRLGNKSLTVVSYEEVKGNALLATNLAVVFAQLGARTLLVDSDLRSGTVHQFFKQENRLGLSDLLAERVDLSCINRVAALPGLSILSRGTEAPNPQELLSRASFKLLIDELEQRFDIVLFNSPALSLCADAQIVAAIARGAILIAYQNQSSIKGLANAQELLRNAGTTLLGCVMSEAG